MAQSALADIDIEQIATQGVVLCGYLYDEILLPNQLPIILPMGRCGELERERVDIFGIELGCT